MRGYELMHDINKDMDFKWHKDVAAYFNKESVTLGSCQEKWEITGSIENEKGTD